MVDGLGQVLRARSRFSLDVTDMGASQHAKGGPENFVALHNKRYNNPSRVSTHGELADTSHA